MTTPTLPQVLTQVKARPLFQLREAGPPLYVVARPRTSSGASAW